MLSYAFYYTTTVSHKNTKIQKKKGFLWKNQSYLFFERLMRINLWTATTTTIKLVCNWWKFGFITINLPTKSFKDPQETKKFRSNNNNNTKKKTKEDQQRNHNHFFNHSNFGNVETTQMRESIKELILMIPFWRNKLKMKNCGGIGIRCWKNTAKSLFWLRKKSIFLYPKKK